MRSTMLAVRRPTTPPTAVSLRRWLCGWLVLLMITQTLGTALAGLQGAWHRHRPALQTAAAPSTPLVRWRHGETVRAADAHAQMHASGEAHDHPATDDSVLPPGADAASDAVAQLAVSAAPGADVRWSPYDGVHHVQAGTAGWAPTTRSIAPPLQPPRS